MLNIYSRALKEAMFEGAENSVYAKDPQDLSKPGSLVQFLTWVADNRFFTTLANNNIGVFCTLFGKMIPRQISMQSDTTVDLTYHSVDDVKRALEAAGMPLKQIEQLEAMLPVDDVM